MFAMQQRRSAGPADRHSRQTIVGSERPTRRHRRAVQLISAQPSQSHRSHSRSAVSCQPPRHTPRGARSTASHTPRHTHRSNTHPPPQRSDEQKDTDSRMGASVKNDGLTNHSNFDCDLSRYEKLKQESTARNKCKRLWQLWIAPRELHEPTNPRARWTQTFPFLDCAVSCTSIRRI